jgi:hypothetical protein
MIVDIFKFFVIFLLVLFSFACGLNHLYWYYAAVHAKECSEAQAANDEVAKESACKRGYRTFAKWVKV